MPKPTGKTGTPHKRLTDEEVEAKIAAIRARTGCRPLPADHPLYQMGWIVGETVPSKRPTRGSQKTDTKDSPSQATADPMRPAIDAVEAYAQERATGSPKKTPRKD